MRFSARFFALVLLLAFLPFLLICIIPVQIYAQTISTVSIGPDVNAYTMPNVENNVPHNQHTYAQSVLIEVLAAVICQLSGIDPVNPKTPCLGVDRQTNKLGYAESSVDQHGNIKIGGILGSTTGMIASMYMPVVSTQVYIQNLAQHFGIVDHAYAVQPVLPNGNGTVANGYGFSALQPVLTLWQSTRNVAYFLLVLAFIFIGIGVMLRVHIDPRTVMTIQNQIPRIVICILLITFSYAIAAIMVDAMWLVTYSGVGLLTTAVPANMVKNCPISTHATASLLNTPIAYVDEIFKADCNGANGSGLFNNLTGAISDSMGGMMTQLINDLLGSSNGNCSFFPPDLSGCVADIVGFFTNLVMKIIVLITLLIVLFKVWWELLKAYTYTLIYVIAAPLWIVLGLLPGRPLGFEKWIRSLFVNLAVFPITAFLFIAARIFVELFRNAQSSGGFIPPLVGNPNTHDFGNLVAFGILLMAPTLLTMLREAMKVPGTKHGAAIAQNFAAGRAIPGMLANKQWANLTRRNATTGKAEGVISRAQDNVTSAVLGKGAQLFNRLPGPAKWIGGMMQDARERRENRNLGSGFDTTRDVLKHKLAAGYINQDEYDQKVTELQKRRGQSPQRRRRNPIAALHQRFQQRRKGSSNGQPPPAGTPSPIPPPQTPGGAGGTQTPPPSGGGSATPIPDLNPDQMEQLIANNFAAIQQNLAKATGDKRINTPADVKQKLKGGDLKKFADLLAREVGKQQGKAWAGREEAAMDTANKQEYAAWINKIQQHLQPPATNPS